MGLTGEQIKDLKLVMGIEEEMIPLLGIFQPFKNAPDRWKPQLDPEPFQAV